MKRLDDERIRFHLKHRQQIEEWVGVKDDLHKFAHEFYASLRDAILGEVSNDVIVGDVVSEPPGNRLFRLRRCGWPEQGLAVELGWWPRGRMDFSRNQWLWCGLYADPNSPYWKHLCDAWGRPETKDYPKQDAKSGYPMLRYIDPPSGNFWEDDQLEKYGQSVIQAVLKAWGDLGPLVDEALNE